MPKFLLLFTFCFYSLCSFAQQRDSCIVTNRDGKWHVSHTIKEGETVFTIARRYHVPPAMLAGANGLDYQATLQKDAEVFVPLGAYNMLSSEPLNENEYRTLYYHVSAEDNLFNIGRVVGVQQRVLQQWNNLPDNSITEGQTLLVGWMLYDNTSSGGFKPVESAITNKPAQPVTSTPQKPATTTPPATKIATTQDAKPIRTLPDGTVFLPMPKKVAVVDTVPPARKMYLAQTNNEEDVTEEKGTAVFFSSPAASKIPYLFYGFHNVAPKGSVIKVYNPGADKTVYVKILGPLPGTKQYHNSILGINSMAKDSLMVVEDRAWCELKYSGKAKGNK